MKPCIIILLLFRLVVSSKLLPVKFETEHNIAKCLHKLIRNEKVYDTRNLAINIHTSSKLEKYYFKDVVDRFLAINRMNFSFEIMQDGIGDMSTDFHTRVFLVGSLSSFMFLVKEQRKFASDKSDLHQYYYVIIPKTITPPKFKQILAEIFKYCLKNFIININLLYENTDTSTEVYTYFPFNENICNDSTAVLHNTCENGHLKWKKPSFPKKVRNLWQCPLKIVIWLEPPFLNFPLISGIDSYFIEFLREVMNFSVEPIFSSKGRGSVSIDGVADGAFKILEEGRGDLMLGGSICLAERNRYFASTINYYSIPVNLIVKQEETYHAMEILLFPFDFYTWVMILILLTAREIGKIIQKCTGHAFGFKLKLFPWLFGLLILQSSYEGSVFKFLHKRPKKPIPNSLKEAIQEGYSFFSSKSLNVFLKDFCEFENKLKLYDISRKRLFDKLYELDGKHGLISRAESYTGINLNNSRIQSMFRVKKPVVLTIACMYMPRFSFLTKELNKRIEQMHTYGFVERILKISEIPDAFALKKRKKQKRDSEAGPIRVHNLWGAFQLLMIMMGLALVTFVGEIFWFDG